MSDVIAVPTLSTNGWVTDNAPKIDWLLAHWVSCLDNQTSLYRGNITSLQAVIEKYQDDMDVCARQIASTLQTYLGRYYSEALVNCRAVLADEKTSLTLVKFILGINYTEAGVIYSADRVISTHSGKFKSITDANNQ